MSQARETRRKITRRLAYQATLLLLAVGKRLSRPVALRLGALLGELAFWLFARERKLCYQNLDRVFGDQKTVKQKRAIALACYQNLGKSFLEVMQLDRYKNKEDISELIAGVAGISYLEAALAEKRPVIFITGHIGNWELLPFALSSQGFPGAIMARRVNNKGIDQLSRDLRLRYNIKTIVSGTDAKTARSLIKLLRTPGKFLGMVIDQDTKRLEGIFADFLGSPAYTMTGPASLALATKASVIPAFIFRQPDGRHRVELHPPLLVKPSADKKADLLAYTTQFNQAISAAILQYPEQWVWMHHRWKQVPVDDS